MSYFLSEIRMRNEQNLKTMQIRVNDNERRNAAILVSYKHTTSRSSGLYRLTDTSVSI